MTEINRRDAIAAYKERKTIPGIFALRCPGDVWVGKATDISLIQNRLWFSLRHGGYGNRSLQAAWITHGEAGFAFEVLETLPDEDMAIVRDAWLRDRTRHWRATLGADLA